MYKTIISYIALLTVSAVIPNSAFAATPAPVGVDPVIRAVVGSLTPPAGIDGSANAVNNYVLTIVNTLLLIGLVLVLGYIVYGGIKWITAGGDSKAVQAAQGTITNAIIGLILLAISFAVAVLFNSFTGSGASGPGTTGPGVACSSNTACASGVCGNAVDSGTGAVRVGVCCIQGGSPWTCI